MARISLTHAMESLLRGDDDVAFNAVLEEIRKSMGYTQTVKEIRLVHYKLFRKILDPDPSVAFMAVLKAMQSDKPAIAAKGQQEVNALGDSILATIKRFPAPTQPTGPLTVDCNLAEKNPPR